MAIGSEPGGSEGSRDTHQRRILGIILAGPLMGCERCHFLCCCIALVVVYSQLKGLCFDQVLQSVNQK